jgi:ABC-type protease/lipase transport system fused ATPase/permease subunit
MMGLLLPSEGTVLIDGRDIRAGSGLASYRRMIAGVMQDDGLFAGTIAENISSFDERLDLAWLRECSAYAAILEDVARTPMGFETLVGDMGSTLAGGQKQRIILARALYRKPQILLLDEATSHLDEPTEARIASALRELKMTRIIVAHRPATIAHADAVVRLGDLSSRGLTAETRHATSSPTPVEDKRCRSIHPIVRELCDSIIHMRRGGTDAHLAALIQKVETKHRGKVEDWMLDEVMTELKRATQLLKSNDRT